MLKLSPRLLTLALLGLSFLLALPALAQEQGDPLTMDEAIRKALVYSPVLAATRNQVQQAELAVKEAFTNYLPTVDTAYSYRRLDSATTINTQSGDFTVGTADNYQWVTTIKQPVFTGFRLDANQRLAELGVDLAKLGLELDRLDLALRVKEAYLEYLRSQQALEVSRQAVTQLTSQLKTSRDFYDVGIIPINDVLKVEVELANARQSEISARNAVNLARSSFNTLLGRPLETKLNLVDKLAFQPYEVPFEEAANRAQANRPELKALKVQIAQANEQVTAARADFWPQVSLQGAYSRNSSDFNLTNDGINDPSETSVSAALSWTLWNWGRTQHQVGQAQAGKMRLENTYRDLEDQVDLQVKQAILFLEESAKAIVTAETAVTQAAENYRITLERYKEQLTTNTEVLDAQTLQTRSQTNYYTSLTVYNLARARLLRSMGQGLPEGLD